MSTFTVRVTAHRPTRALWDTRRTFALRVAGLDPRPGGAHGFAEETHAFSLLPHGRRRWLLLPPSGDADVYTTAKDRHQFASTRLTPIEWLRRYHAAPELLDRRTPLLQCTQPAGTALFVPSGWKRAVLNLRTSVGVAIELGDFDVISRYMKMPWLTQYMNEHLTSKSGVSSAGSAPLGSAMYGVVA